MVTSEGAVVQKRGTRVTIYASECRETYNHIREQNHFGKTFARHRSMSLWNHAPSFTGEPLLPPRLLLLQNRRENLLAHSERLSRELDEVTRQIDLELRRERELNRQRSAVEMPAA